MLMERSGRAGAPGEGAAAEGSAGADGPAEESIEGETEASTAPRRESHLDVAAEVAAEEAEAAAEEAAAAASAAAKE